MPPGELPPAAYRRKAVFQCSMDSGLSATLPFPPTKRQKSAHADFCLSTIQRLASLPARHQNRVRIPTRAAIWLLEPLPELPKKLELEPISACTGTPLFVPVAF